MVLELDVVKVIGNDRGEFFYYSDFVCNSGFECQKVVIVYDEGFVL